MVKWHVFILQEAIEYLDHNFLTNRFHVTHDGGCAILFNKDTFFSDIKVTSIYLHDVRNFQPGVGEESGWVLQGVISRASFRRQRRGGESFYTVMSPHINNNYAKEAPGPTPLWGPGSIPVNCADICGFLKPAGSHRFWKVHKHGAFSIPRKTLG